ncbi:MAG: ice-binding family protein [Ignavibacteriaceae bacterium]
MKIHTINSTSILSRCIRLIGAILTITLMMPAISYSQYSNPAAVPLLTAGTYGALASSGISGSGNVTGDVGTVTGSITGITYTGTNWGVGGTHNASAQTDLGAALTNANGRSNDSTISGDALGGLTLTRGVYSGVALDLASGTTLTLNGSSTDIFIIRASSTLNINTNSTISLTGGAVWSNVFWYVGSSATIYSGTTFNGIILAVSSITLNASATLVTSQFLANTGAVTINSNVLPVELTTFTAALNNNAVELNWNTATEVNNYGFDIERSQMSEASSQNLTWNKIGFVKGSGNSNSPKNYSFVDNTVYYGSYAYRLKQIDNDGTYKYSSVVEVNAGQMQYSFLLNQNYPNPFNPSTEIQFGVSKNSPATLTIFNVLGEKVATLFNGNAVAGQVYNVTLNGSNLASGIYYYKLQTNDNTEVKKMLLMK